MNNWTDLVVSLAVAAVPIIGAWISKQLLANKQALTLVKVIRPIGKCCGNSGRTAWCDTGD